MSIPEFNAKELEIVGAFPRPTGPATPIYSYPVTPKEGVKSTFSGSPIWQLTGVEQKLFAPKCNPDNTARAFVYDGTNTPKSDGGGADMFGIEWEYVPQVGGSMVRPGNAFIEDANDIAAKVKWPDIDKWDWEGCAKANTEYLTSDSYVCAWFLNGWYERLISFMEFEDAAVALIDEDQQDAVKAFFDKLSDLYIKIFDKYLTYFPQIDGFCIHDDWGSQKETFFAPSVVEEMIVPYMRRVTDYLHSKGKFCELHSCGQILKQVPNIIAAGWDAWAPQAMNDTHKIYELYGDKLLVHVIPEPFDTANTTEEEQREAARKYAAAFCNPKKPSLFSMYGSQYLAPAFSDEMYKQSRSNFDK